MTMQGVYNDGTKDVVRPVKVTSTGELVTSPTGVSIKVIGSVIPDHNNVLMTYTGSNLTTVQYRLNTTVVATITMTYDESGNMLTATRS